jgi:hypothetical protein
MWHGVVWRKFTDVFGEHLSKIKANKQAVGSNHSVTYLLSLLYDPEDGNSIFLRNVGKLHTHED